MRRRQREQTGRDRGAEGLFAGPIEATASSERASSGLEKHEGIPADREKTVAQVSSTSIERDAMQARAETATANPSKASVRDILQRIERHDGYGLRESEIRKLAEHVRQLEALIAKRASGWYPDERTYLEASGIL